MPLNTKSPVGNGVSKPEYFDGVENIISTQSADMTNADTTLNVGYNQANLSAKFKNPQNKQDIPAEGNNQYL